MDSDLLIHLGEVQDQDQDLDLVLLRPIHREGKVPLDLMLAMDHNLVLLIHNPQVHHQDLHLGHHLGHHQDHHQDHHKTGVNVLQTTKSSGVQWVMNNRETKHLLLPVHLQECGDNSVIRTLDQNNLHHSIITTAITNGNHKKTTLNNLLSSLGTKVLRPRWVETKCRVIIRLSRLRILPRHQVHGINNSKINHRISLIGTNHLVTINGVSHPVTPMHLTIIT